MNIQQRPAWQKAATTYNAAADHFDDPPLAFWGRHGQRSVDLLDLQPGEHVLDVGCGTGASAIPAGRAVGRTGRVVAIDVAENMLDRARAKARQQDLPQIEFELADMSATGYADGSFDAVVSVFSVFFVPDMTAQVAELWRLLRPGGRLCITVWCDGAFGPAAPLFLREALQLKPDLPMPTRPWEVLTDPDNLRALLLAAGTTEPQIIAVPDRQKLDTPEDWWTLAMGSGYRSEIEQFRRTDRERLRRRTSARLMQGNIDYVDVSAMHALAGKPATYDRAAAD